MSTDLAVTNGLLPAKKRKILNDDGTADVVVSIGTPSAESTKRPGMTKARQIRLEQNRKSARESRIRKKAMLEELQRAVVFFTKTNAALRTEHHLLTRKLLNAHAELSNLGLAIPDASKVEDAKCPPSLTAVTMPIVAASVEPGATMQGTFRIRGEQKSSGNSLSLFVSPCSNGNVSTSGCCYAVHGSCHAVLGNAPRYRYRLNFIRCESNVFQKNLSRLNWMQQRL
jgi:hypothetical protein